MTIDVTLWHRKPKAGDTCAVTVHSMWKRASFLFDRVHLYSRIFAAVHKVRDLASYLDRFLPDAYIHFKSTADEFANLPPSELTFGIDEYDVKALSWTLG